MLQCGIASLKIYSVLHVCVGGGEEAGWLVNFVKLEKICGMVCETEEVFTELKVYIRDDFGQS